MQIKKYVGEIMKEVTDRMRKELGPEAIVLNTRKVPNSGFLNFLGKDMIEITAGIDDQPLSSEFQSDKTTDNSAFAFRQGHGNDRRANVEPKTTVDELQAVAEKAESRMRSESRQHASISTSNAEVQMLRSELEEMRGVMMQIADHLKYSKMPALPLYLQQAFANLVKNDVEEKVAADIIQSVYGRLDGERLAQKESVESAILEEMSQFFRTISLPKEKMKRPYIVVLVGPTGVGKTTTIAKLAALHKLIHHQNIGLITTDTYRIGAIEQLRTFAGIADIPMQVVYQPKDMQEALKRFRKNDIVFIDTVGRSQHAKKELGELRRLLEVAEPDETHVVLNASSNHSTLIDIVEQFKLLKPNRLLISKVDEALSLGALLSLVRRCQWPISYITNGQAVPDDVLAVDAHQLARMVSNGIIAHA